MRFLAFEFDEEKGIIRNKLTGERCIVVYEKGLESVFKGLSQIFKAGIEVLLEESSRAAGKHIADSISRDAKTDIKASLRAYAKRFAQNGLGRLEVTESRFEEAGLMRFRVWDNIFGDMRDKESTYCAYVAGLLSGLYEGFFHVSPKVEEVKCIGRGDPYCEFLLTLKVP